MSRPADGMAPGPPARRSWGARMASNPKVLIGAGVTVLGAVASVVTILAFFSSGVPRFAGDVSDAGAAARFVEFATGHDQAIVHVDLECVESEAARCDARSTPPGFDTMGQLVLAVYPGATKPAPEACGSLVLVAETVPTGAPCEDVSWFHVHIPEAGDAQLSNGPTGAGSIVLKGYFSVSVRGPLGTAPPGVSNIVLNAINAAEVPE